MQRFKNKIAVITGGNSGIGYATAERLKEEGAQVVIVGRNQERVQEAARSLGADVVGLTADVAQGEHLDRAYDEISRRFGRIDLLFANAGIASFAPVTDVTEEIFDSVTNVNQRGLFFSVQKALPLLHKGSSVVINTSVTNEMGFANATVYAATKAAARSFVRGFAGELAPRGIRVNAVAPGPVETPIYGKIGLPQEGVKAFADQIQSQVPLKRFGKPEEIASAVAFLGSEDASFITGIELVADGGMTQV